MQQPIFTFDSESAKASGAGGASETGAYTGTIKTALFTKSQDPDSQSESMEFALDSDVGQINYLRVSYIGRDGSPLKGGTAMINAIMGLTKVKALHATELVNDKNETELHCRELEGKPVGFVLQKVLYTKNDGRDGYRFEIRQAFGANTRKTFKEAVDNLAPEAVDKLVASLSDRDERQQQPQGMMSGTGGSQQRSMLGGGQSGWGAPQQPQSNLQRNAGGGRNNQQQAPQQDWDDDIPF